jgi:hypothetical protein
MRDGEPATANAVRVSLLALGAALVDPLDAPDEGVLQHARKLWVAHAHGFGLVLLDDHDPHVAPGLHVVRTTDPLALTRVQQLTRSWEAFDRAFEACPMTLEQALFDARIAPCFEALGAPLAQLDLARDHLFVIDERYVASFPEERWAAHVARSANSTDASSEHEHERVLRGLRLVCAAPCTPV